MYSTLLLLILSFSSVLALLEIEHHKAELKNRPNKLISVETELGTLIGYKQQVGQTSRPHHPQHINVFYGVPYAEPPVQKLRFRKTKLIKKFPVNPYDALDFKPHCEQPHAKKYHADDRFDENCLYANIWTPNLENARDENGKCKKLSNVMLYIFGGTSSAYQMLPFKDTDEVADYLLYFGEVFAQQDSILVTFNFRYVSNNISALQMKYLQVLLVQWTKAMQ